MTIRRLPDFRMPLLDRWLCRQLRPHDIRVLVKEFVEGLVEGFYDYLPDGAAGTIMEFLGTEHYKLYWTCRCHRQIFRWIFRWIGRAAAAHLAEATTSPVSQPTSEEEERTLAHACISLLLGAEGSPSEDL